MNQTDKVHSSRKESQFNATRLQAAGFPRKYDRNELIPISQYLDCICIWQCIKRFTFEKNVEAEEKLPCNYQTFGGVALTSAKNGQQQTLLSAHSLAALQLPWKFVLNQN